MAPITTTESAPSAGQVRWLTNLGFTRAQVAQMDRRSAGLAIEDSRRAATTRISPQQHENLQGPDETERVWLQMDAWFRYQLRGDLAFDHRALVETALAAVEFFDHQVRHREAWPDDIDRVLEDYGTDELVELVAERLSIP